MLISRTVDQSWVFSHLSCRWVIMLAFSEVSDVALATSVPAHFLLLTMTWYRTYSTTRFARVNGHQTSIASCLLRDGKPIEAIYCFVALNSSSRCRFIWVRSLIAMLIRSNAHMGRAMLLVDICAVVLVNTGVCKPLLTSLHAPDGRHSLHTAGSRRSHLCEPRLPPAPSPFHVIPLDWLLSSFLVFSSTCGVQRREATGTRVAYPTFASR